MKKTFSLTELAAAVNVPERTIRFYITKGLLPPPVSRGRKAYYSDEHKQIISQIKDLQSRGLTLSEIAGYLAISRQRETSSIEKPTGYYLSKNECIGRNLKELSPIPEISTWYVYKIGDDINVHIKSGVSAWRIRKIINVLKTITEEQI
ncbi:MAG: helix-turn-helix domain-containing protein [Verrucomicrobiia bacterium]|jgi:DNA-binding transcriptional MerR regulator